MHQNIHFGAKTCKTGFYVLSLFFFLAIKRKHKESTKEMKRKTCCCLERSNERGSNGCCRRTVCTFTQPIVTCGDTVAVQGRSHFNRSRVDGVNHRLRKSAGLPAFIHSIRARKARGKQLRVSLLLWYVSSSLCIAIKERKKCT